MTSVVIMMVHHSTYHHAVYCMSTDNTKHLVCDIPYSVIHNNNVDGFCISSVNIGVYMRNVYTCPSLLKIISKKLCIHVTLV